MVLKAFRVSRHGWLAGLATASVAAYLGCGGSGARAIISNVAADAAVNDASGPDAMAATDDGTAPSDADGAYVDGEPQDAVPGDADGGGDADGSVDADADGDAAPDGGDAGDGKASTGLTQALLTGSFDGDCLSCADACLTQVGTCDALAGAVAVTGLAAGQSREMLCLDTLACELQTMCYAAGSGVGVCLCGPETQGDCTRNGTIPDAGEGCVPQESAGLETADARAEFVVEFDAGLGAGMANVLIECIHMCPACP